jgi:hypothetical protein
MAAADSSFAVANFLPIPQCSECILPRFGLGLVESDHAARLLRFRPTGASPATDFLNFPVRFSPGRP